MFGNEPPSQFEARKQDHLRLALEAKHQAYGYSGFENLSLVHEALPDLNWEDLSIATHSLGSKRQTPFFISGMTAGHSDAFKLNACFAEACSKRGWAFGVGSQRRELFEPNQSLKEWSAFRERFPDLVVFANLGISQVIEPPFDAIQSVINSVRAQGLVVHLNPLQECLQIEGTPRFKGGQNTLRELAQKLSIPLIVKETGCGISGSTVMRLRSCGVAAVDVSGLGGTHWGRIEGSRNVLGSPKNQAAEVFKRWGISTVDSLIEANQELKGLKESLFEVWASGGIRSGLDAAKSIALGASQVGFAKPALEAAQKGVSGLETWMQQIELELKIALFCTGSAEPSLLRDKVQKIRHATFQYSGQYSGQDSVLKGGIE